MARIEIAPKFDMAGVTALMQTGDLLHRLKDAAIFEKGYHPWRYVKYHTPNGVDPKLWWSILQIARAPHPIEGLLNRSGGNFIISSPGELQKGLHEVDRSLGFSLETDSPYRGLDEGLRRVYIQRSLTEEAISSSQMEGAVTTREVAREMILKQRAPQDNSERMILNNYITMSKLKQWKEEPLSLELLAEIHRQITEGTIDGGKQGRIRKPGDQPVQVDDGMQVYHYGTDAAALPERLQRLCDFANSKDDGVQFLHPIVKAAILHFMIGYEHPFSDGNGRTARSIFYWYLLRMGYWIMEFLSISSLLHMPDWRKRYNEAYTDVEYGGSDLTYFVLMQVDVLKAADREFHAYVDRRQKNIRELRTFLHGVVNDRQIDLLAHAERHPGYEYRPAEHAKWHGVALNTARADLEELEEKGFLKMVLKGRARTYLKV